MEFYCERINSLISGKEEACQSIKNLLSLKAKIIKIKKGE